MRASPGPGAHDHAYDAIFIALLELFYFNFSEFSTCNMYFVSFSPLNRVEVQRVVSPTSESDRTFNRTF